MVEIVSKDDIPVVEGLVKHLHSLRPLSFVPDIDKQVHDCLVLEPGNSSLDKIEEATKYHAYKCSFHYLIQPIQSVHNVPLVYVFQPRIVKLSPDLLVIALILDDRLRSRVFYSQLFVPFV